MHLRRPTLAFRWSSHGLQCEPSSGSPCGAQHWLCGSPCASQCEPSRRSPCAGCLPPVSPYSRSPTSCMVKAPQGRLWFKVLVIGISSREKQHSKNTLHFEIMLHARNSFVSSLQTTWLVSRRLRSGWLRFLVATDCRGGALEVSHTALLGHWSTHGGWFEVGLSELNRGRGGTQDPAALLPPIPLYRANILYPPGEEVQTSNNNNNFGTGRGRVRVG